MIALENVRVFMRTAELGSFSAAGRSLSLSPSVISYRIHALEQHLNCLLVNRTTRRMSLTCAGRVFYEKCVDILTSVESAENSVTQMGGTPFGMMQVTAPVRLGRRVIADAALEFRRRSAETTLHLILTDHLLDLVKDSIDVAIRIGRMRDSSCTLRKIANVERVLCASPEYLGAWGVPIKPDNLNEHQCLLLRFPGSQPYRWTLMVDEQPVSVYVDGHIDTDNSDVLLDWALKGQGIVMMSLFEAAPYIAANRLVPVLRSFPPSSATLGFLYPTRRMLPTRVKHFVDLTLDMLRQHIAGELASLDSEAIGYICNDWEKRAVTNRQVLPPS